MTIFGARLVEYILIGSDTQWQQLVIHKVATPLKHTLLYFTLNGFVIYKMDILLCWRRLETND